jgi:iron complex outermembrane receptor protein
MQITRGSGAERKSFATLSIAGTLFVLLWLTAGRLLAAERDPSVDVKIVAGSPLEPVLIAVGDEAGLHLASATYYLAGHTTPVLQGKYRFTEVLKKLLEGSGLTYKIEGTTFYVLPISPQQRPPSRPKRPPAPVLRAQDDGGAAEVDEGMPSVTIGSHIPNSSDPKYPPPPGIFTLRRAEFVESDFQTLGEALRSLPANFPGGQNPGVISAGGSQNIGSLSGVSSPDLHGMGASSTLTLVNGQRLATAESFGAVDLSLLPLSVVERVEVLTGGTSAIYGSDAVAGTVNVVLRDEFEGLEAKSALGRAVDGGGNLQHYSLIGGHNWDPASGWYAAGDCARQRSIDSSQRGFVPAAVAGTTLLPKTQDCSSVLNAKGQFQGGATASLVGVYTTRGNDTTANLGALSQGVSAAVHSSVTQYAAIGTFQKPFGADWAGTVTSSVSADNVHSPEQLIASGIPPVNESDHFDDRLRSIEMNAVGTLLHLPAGPWKLAAGSGYNEETFLFSSSPPQPVWIAQRRRIRYLFGEGLIPLWSSKVDSLSLRLAGRKSRYSDVGSTTNPKVTLQYQSAQNFSVGASWGTSYRAPTLVQQYNQSQTTLKVISDPGVPSDSSLALFQFGGNPHLRPEVSSDVTVDFAFTPPTLPDTLVKITWYDINDRKRIEYPTTNTGAPLSDPNVAPFVTRNPSTAPISQTLAESPLNDQTAGAYLPGQAGVLIDDLEQNISHQRASGVDLFASYGHDTPIGKLKTSASISYLDLWQQVTSVSRDERLSGTVFNPPMLRSRIGLTWNKGNYLGSLFFNYTGTSRDTQIDPAQHIGSWETFDLTLGYIIPRSEHWGNTRFTLSAKNMLDRRPPFVSIHQQGSPAVNFDSTNASATGAFLTLGVAVEF